MTLEARIAATIQNIDALAAEAHAAHVANMAEIDAALANISNAHIALLNARAEVESRS